jgi:MFS family permease
MHLGSPFSPIRADPLAFRRITLLFTCVVVGFVMNVIISAVTPFFPQEAARLANASEGMVGTIMAILPLTSMILYPVVRLVSTQEPKSRCMLELPSDYVVLPWSTPWQLIKHMGRDRTLQLGLLVLSVSTIGFGLSRGIAAWCAMRALQGAGWAMAGMFIDHMGIYVCVYI